MAAAKPSKKSETIEVRLSFEAKTAFMDRCRAEQRTASDAIRTFIDERIGSRQAARGPRLPRRWRMAAALAAGAALGAGVAAPSLAHANATSRASFEQLDRNHDGALSYAEFRGR